VRVILLKDVESLGSAGEVVQVKDGFGRNFLLLRWFRLFVPTSGKQNHAEDRQHARKLPRGSQAPSRHLPALEHFFYLQNFHPTAK